VGRQWLAFSGPSGFVIGRDPSCQVRLDNKFVSARHASVERGQNGWELTLLSGVNPIEVDQQVLKPGHRISLGSSAHIRIVNYLLTLEDGEEQSALQADEAALNELQQLLHANIIRRLELRLDDLARPEQQAQREIQLNAIIDDLLFGEFNERALTGRSSERALRIALRWRLSEYLLRAAKSTSAPAAKARFGQNPDLEREVEAIVEEMARYLKLDPMAGAVDNEDRIDRGFAQAFTETTSGVLGNVRTYIIVAHLKQQLHNLIFGLGPLESLIHSPAVSEIMVVNPSTIYIERNGRLIRTGYSFPNSEAAMAVIERIVAPLGRRIDRSQPLVDARLKDGSRVNAIIEPLALQGPCITIRKFPTYRVGVEDLM